MKVISLMEIKDFSQCIAANKQQWCGLVAVVCKKPDSESYLIREVINIGEENTFYHQ